MVEEVILVDEQGAESGHAEKLAVHRDGRLHRAFSIFLFNSAGGMLLQQRASGKYHFAGLWSNACCSHPLRGETVQQAAARRLRQELGIAADVAEVCTLIYRAEDPHSELVEHEYDHALIGRHEGPVHPNPGEIDAVRWIEPSALLAEIESNPAVFTPWFKLLLPKILESRTGAPQAS